jgi:diacylglycerol kinase family enzyme
VEFPERFDLLARSGWIGHAPAQGIEMNISCILNRDGGTLKTTDLDALSERITDRFSQQGHRVDIKIVAGDDVMSALEGAARDVACEGLLVGGGDGTVSGAAQIAARAEKPLGILPAGTMNMFARALGTPLDLNEAVDALANGREAHVDIAEIEGGQMFVHQLSLGLHPRMVRLREENDFGSKLGKMSGSAKALIVALMDARALPLVIELDGHTEQAINTAALSISNNLYGEGHMPYADTLTGSVLGIYVSRTTRFSQLARLAFDTGAGHLPENPNMDIHEAQTVQVRHRRNRSMTAVIDGELVDIGSKVTVHIRPGGLKVILPGIEAIRDDDMPPEAEPPMGPVLAPV